MTKHQHAARAEIAMQSLHAEIAAAKDRRPSCPWPRHVEPNAVQGWRDWSAAVVAREW